VSHIDLDIHMHFAHYTLNSKLRDITQFNKYVLQKKLCNLIKWLKSPDHVLLLGDIQEWKLKIHRIKATILILRMWIPYLYSQLQIWP
jgi:hypothetical protein